MPDASLSISSAAAAGQQQSALSVDQRSNSCRPKLVNFRGLTRTYLIPTLDEFTEDDYNRIFLTEKDRNKIQHDIIDSIAAMRINGQQSDHCLRGLESIRSHSHSEKAKTRRLQVINAVLDEQDLQWDEHDDIVDHERLSQASMRHSSSAIEDAIARATEDSLFVQL